MKQHTVKTLIERLEQLPQDYDTVFEEKGGMYRSYISQIYYKEKWNQIILSNSRNKKFSVGDLVEKLKIFNQDLKISFYENGGVYDTIVSNAFLSHYDENNKLKIITLKNS